MKVFKLHEIQPKYAHVNSDLTLRYSLNFKILCDIETSSRSLWPKKKKN